MWSDLEEGQKIQSPKVRGPEVRSQFEQKTKVV